MVETPLGLVTNMASTLAEFSPPSSPHADSTKEGGSRKRRQGELTPKLPFILSIKAFVRLIGTYPFLPGVRVGALYASKQCSPASRAEHWCT